MTPLPRWVLVAFIAALTLFAAWLGWLFGSLSR